MQEVAPDRPKPGLPSRGSHPHAYRPRGGGHNLVPRRERLLHARTGRRLAAPWNGIGHGRSPYSLCLRREASEAYHDRLPSVHCSNDDLPDGRSRLRGRIQTGAEHRFPDDLGSACPLYDIARATRTRQPQGTSIGSAALERTDVPEACLARVLDGTAIHYHGLPFVTLRECVHDPLAGHGRSRGATVAEFFVAEGATACLRAGVHCPPRPSQLPMLRRHVSPYARYSWAVLWHVMRL